MCHPTILQKRRGLTTVTISTPNPIFLSEKGSNSKNKMSKWTGWGEIPFLNSRIIFLFGRFATYINYRYCNPTQKPDIGKKKNSNSRVIRTWSFGRKKKVYYSLPASFGVADAFQVLREMHPYNLRNSKAELNFFSG